MEALRSTKIIATVLLGADASEFFNQQCKDRLPGAPFFTEDGETPWRRHVWARAVQTALKSHNRDASAKRRISGHVTAYSFRHAHPVSLTALVSPLPAAQVFGCQDPPGRPQEAASCHPECTGYASSRNRTCQ